MRVTLCGLLCCVTAIAALLAGRLPADQPTATKPTVGEFQKRIDEYGKRWTMANGAIDLTKLDQFYASGEGVIIFDLAPPGVSTTWKAHRKGLDKEYEQGIAIFDDAKAIFESAKQLPVTETWRKPHGHPIHWDDDGKKWLLFGSPNPNVRVQAARSLRQHGTRSARQALKAAKGDHDGRVRGVANEP